MDISNAKELLSDSRLSDSSDDELPDLCDNLPIPADWIEKLSSGEIVWAEFRQVYWPAMVRHVYKKDKKVSIWYLDSPNKTFKVPFKKVKSFDDTTIIDNNRQKVEESPLKGLHKKVYLNAITYIRRKCEGCNDDPVEFFDMNKHYLSFKHIESMKGKENPPDKKIPCSVTVAPEFTISDEESLYSGSDEDDVINKKLSIFYDIDDSNEDDPRADMIVKCIVSGNTNTHLIRIREKKEASKYLSLYEEAKSTDQKNFLGVDACEVINDTNKLRELSVYLLNLFEKHVEGEKCNMVDYVMCVWLPEAIKKAVEMVDSNSFRSVDDIPKRELFPTDKLLVHEKNDLFTEMKDKEVKNKKSFKRKIDAKYDTEATTSAKNYVKAEAVKRNSRKK